jgi:hypothetical protein
MSITRVFNLGELQLKVSPFLQKEGSLLRCLNVERDATGNYKKRRGYTTYLGTADGFRVNSLFSWIKNDGTTFHNYRYSGSTLYYSKQGTTAWTAPTNGTFTTNSYMGHEVLDDVMIVGDGTAPTSSSTSGTLFGTVAGAPRSSQFIEFQGRIYAGRGTANSGTDTNWFYSSTGTATDWTTDSSSIRIPGEGKILSSFKSSDRGIVTKDTGNIFKWDGDNLVDTVTNLGPSSPYSIASIEGYRLWLNRKGFYGFGGVRPEIVSNAIERQIYNDANTGIIGSQFDVAPAGIYKYDYFCAVGSLTDDLTGETVPNCVMKYNFQDNEWANWSFANFPTAFGAYKDEAGNEQLIWGDAGGQCYKLSGTALSDNGQPIETAMMGMLHFGNPETDKKFNYIWAFSSPGCQAKVQVAVADTFTKGKLNWIDLKQTKDGVMEARFPAGTQGKLLFWKHYEMSKDAKWTFYGFSVDKTDIKRT